MDPFEHHLPTQVLFGENTLSRVGDVLLDDHERIVIVTDPQVAAQTPAIEYVRQTLGERLVSVIEDTEENPGIESGERGAEVARAASANLILGVGGGSCLDAAKGIALLATGARALTDILDGAPFEGDPLPTICIPTTSGTGSEVTPYAVFTDRARGLKRGYANEKLFPIAAIVDPALTYSMPGELVVNTGMDVITHAIEAFLSTDATPPSDVLALEALEIAVAELGAAREADHAAMQRMAHASTVAGMAIARAGTILLHIMAYPLTVLHQVPHGRANAVLLPAFLEFMERKSTRPERVAKVIELFGRHGLTPAAFVSEQGIDARLSKCGVEEDELLGYAQQTIVKDDVRITPAPVGVEDIAKLYRAAF